MASNINGVVIDNGLLQGHDITLKLETTSSAGGTVALPLPVSGVDAPFRGLTAGTAITLTPNANDVEIATTAPEQIIDDFSLRWVYGANDIFVDTDVVKTGRQCTLVFAGGPFFNEPGVTGTSFTSDPIDAAYRPEVQIDKSVRVLDPLLGETVGIVRLRTNGTMSLYRDVEFGVFSSFPGGRGIVTGASLTYRTAA